MSDDVKKYTEDEKQLLNEIVTKQREIAEKHGKDSAEFKRYIDQSDAAMKKLDEKQEEIIKQMAEKEAKEKENKERIEHLERISSNYNEGSNKEHDPHLVANALFTKNWVNFVNKNTKEAQLYVDEIKHIIDTQGNDTPAEVKNFENAIIQMKASNNLYRTDIAEQGGFLVPVAWSNRLREQIIEYSPMRSFATVETLSGKSIMMPIEQGVGTAQWEGEAEENPDNSTANYTNEELTPHRLAKTVPITWEMLNNSGYNVSNRIMTIAQKAFGVAEGQAFVNGNGIKKPLGFTMDPNVPIFESATSTLKLDDVIKITGELKQGYNPRYYFNRRTLVYLRTLKDDYGRFLWAGPFGDAASGSPATINGIPYSAAFIEMDDYDVNDGYPILFADMREFYSITDRTDMIIIRDEVTKKKQAIVEFEVMKWTHGQPILKEAGVLLKKIA